MVKGADTTWHMTHHMTRHMTWHVTWHVTRPGVAGPCGGDHVAVTMWQWPCGSGRVAVTVWRWPCGGDCVAVTVWRWPCGGGRVAMAVWRWPCGGHMTCHVTWQDNPLHVTSVNRTHFYYTLRKTPMKREKKNLFLIKKEIRLQIKQGRRIY